jgi:hypothetical protein
VQVTFVLVADSKLSSSVLNLAQRQRLVGSAGSSARSKVPGRVDVVRLPVSVSSPMEGGWRSGTREPRPIVYL